MIQSPQISNYNKFKADNARLNSNAKNHNFLLSLPVKDSFVKSTKASGVSFKAKDIETRRAYIYSKTQGIGAKPTPVNVIREDLGGMIIHTVKDLKGEELGAVRMIMSEHDINSELEMNLYEEGKDSLVISGLHSNGNKDYKGVGTVLMQSALKESYRQNRDGRISLFALSGRSPTPFYYKIGLRFPDSYQNEKMEEYLESKANGENPKLANFISSGRMYLPEENVKILKNYNCKVTEPVKEFERLSKTTSYATIYPKRASNEAARTIIKKVKSKNEEVYKMHISYGDEPIGYITVGLPKHNHDARLGHELKDYFRDSVVVETLCTDPANRRYKGIGTALMKQAVYDSIEKGHGGKICLKAKNPRWDGRYPTVFYYKLGLRFPDNEQNELMEKYIKAKKINRRTSIPLNIQTGAMYLPEKNIGYLLNKKIQE